MALDNLWICAPTLITLIVLLYGLLFKSMFCSCDYIINIFYSLFKLWTKPSKHYKVCMLNFCFQHVTIIAIETTTTYHASQVNNSTFFITPAISMLRMIFSEN